MTPYQRIFKPAPEADVQLEEEVFRDGDTISGLAHRSYGDWRLWRIIADRNHLVDVRAIPIGTLLLIPPQPLESGRYEST